MSFIRRYGHAVLTIYVTIVFVQSLFFKFSRSPETVYIFEEKLDPWATQVFGISGLFAHGGPFSAYVVGVAELLASLMLLAGLAGTRLRVLQGLGALLGLGVISGAIFFHLFTPLGVAVRNADGTSDGGALFAMACGVWLACAGLIGLRREPLLGLIGRLRPHPA